MARSQREASIPEDPPEFLPVNGSGGRHVDRGEDSADGLDGVDREVDASLEPAFLLDLRRVAVSRRRIHPHRPRPLRVTGRRRGPTPRGGGAGLGVHDNWPGAADSGAGQWWEGQDGRGRYASGDRRSRGGAQELAPDLREAVRKGAQPFRGRMVFPVIATVGFQGPKAEVRTQIYEDGRLRRVQVQASGSRPVGQGEEERRRAPDRRAR